MNEHERAAIVAVDWGLALMIAAVTGWCALRLGVPLLAAGAALVGFLVGLGAMHWAGARPLHYRLPAFAIPDWPEWAELRAAEALPEGVVRLPLPRLPTAGELEARIQRHLQQKPAASAEVIPLVTDAGSALREALAGLKRAQS